MHGVPEVVHADRGTSMTSKPVAQLLVDLGVDPLALPAARVSNDNPYSEAAVQDPEVRARSSPTGSAPWPTPARSARRSSPTTTTSTATPASGCTPRPPSTTAPPTEIRAQRQQTLDAAYAAHPERFATADPSPAKLPTEAWINQPSREALIQSA